MAGYQFGFLMEQSLGHVTHTKNLLTNVALDPEVHAKVADAVRQAAIDSGACERPRDHAEM